MHREVGVRRIAPRSLIAMLLGVAIVLLLVASETAHATCISSTPNGAPFSDPVGDVVTAPDIGDIAIVADAKCNLGVNPLVSGLDTSTEKLVTIIDTDGNASTGDPDFGAEAAVIVYGDPATPGPPILVFWNGLGFDLSHYKVLPSIGAAGFFTNLDELGVSTPTTLAFGFYTTDGTDYDDAPDTGAYLFPVSFVASSPPPPTPPPPTASTSTPPKPAPVPPATVQKKAGCTVPKVKGKSVSRAKKVLEKAGCKYKIKGKGQVVSTNPRAGAQTTDTVQVKAKKKRKRHRTRALLRTALAAG
jgi:hypothetical protein